MKQHHIQIVLALAASLAASAQPPHPPGDRMPPSPVIGAIDADRDGSLSAAEIANAATALATLDANGDGSLIPDELRPRPPEGAEGPKKGGKPAGPPQGGPQKRPGPPIIGVLDGDHNGTISAEEIKASPEALKALDKNGDGTISPKELFPKGPPHEGGPKGGGRPPGPPPAPEEEGDAAE